MGLNEYPYVISKLMEQLEAYARLDLSVKDAQIEVADIFFKVSREVSNVSNHDLENLLLDFSCDFDWLGTYSNDPEKYREKFDSCLIKLKEST